jgi:hypothetical protein
MHVLIRAGLAAFVVSQEALALLHRLLNQPTFSSP